MRENAEAGQRTVAAMMSADVDVITDKRRKLGGEIREINLRLKSATGLTTYDSCRGLPKSALNLTRARKASPPLAKS